MKPEICINGRFLTQKMTGVQRFATEIVAAIDRLAEIQPVPRTCVIAPRSPAAPPPYRNLGLRRSGLSGGHLWEQAELPLHVGGCLLVNLGNTGPVLAGRRQIVVIHDAGVFDTPDSYSRSFRAAYKAVQRVLVREGARIVTVSRFSRTRIAERLGIEESRIAVLSEGADHILRVVADPSILSRYGLRPGGYVLVVGSRVGHKNLGALGDTARMLERRGLTMAIVGAVNLAVFNSVDRELNFPATVLGRVSDAALRALYENAACLVYPSRYEGFGLSPVEAMACLCPVITSSAGALPEVCGDGALYFESATPRGIMDAVARVIDDGALAGRLRERGRAWVRAFTWERAARLLLDAAA